MGHGTGLKDKDKDNDFGIKVSKNTHTIIAACGVKALEQGIL